MECLPCAGHLPGVEDTMVNKTNLAPSSILSSVVKQTKGQRNQENKENYQLVMDVLLLMQIGW